MASSIIVLVIRVICGLATWTLAESMPQVKTAGDTLPFVSRAGGAAAHSHSCLDGTEFIVTFADHVSYSDAAGILNDRLGGSPLNRCRSLRHTDKVAGQLNAMTVCVPPKQDVEMHLQVMLAMEGVEAVEENQIVNVIGDPFTAMEMGNEADPPRNQMTEVPWHLDRIDQISLPLDGTYDPMGTGHGIRIYVPDTGSDASHPEFEGRVMPGYSAIHEQSATHDAATHGTHVTGILGSKSYGVAKSATMIPIKVFDDRGTGASSADIVEGINWVISQEANQTTTAVLSMSLGSESEGFYAGEQALLRAVEAGIIPIAAAGNDHKDACGYWPAQSPSVITVGSTDQKDFRSSFSNFGSCVDIYAPGSQVTSTLPGGRVGVMSGTSMATPVVSGVVALYLEQHPVATFQEVQDALLRNAVGQKSIVAAANRILLVQAKQHSPSAFVATSQTSIPSVVEKNAPGSFHNFGSGILLLGVGCTALVAFKLQQKRSSRNSMTLQLDAIVF